MRARRVGGGLLFLMGLVLLLWTIRSVLRVIVQGDWMIPAIYPYMIFISIGLPLFAVFFSTAWALWTGRQVRPMLGGGILMAALMDSVLLAWLTIYTYLWVRQSADLFAGLAFVFLLPFWPVVVFLTLLAWWLLRRHGSAFAPWEFIGIALAWLVACAGCSVIVPIVPDEEPIAWWLELLARPEEVWPVLAFFLTPAVLALGLAGTREGGPA